MLRQYQGCFKTKYKFVYWIPCPSTVSICVRKGISCGRDTPLSPLCEIWVNMSLQEKIEAIVAIDDNAERKAARKELISSLSRPELKEARKIFKSLA